MIYDESSKRIMLLGMQKVGEIDDDGLAKEGDRMNDIWTYSIATHESESAWQLYPAKMPHTAERDVFLAFDSIVFVLYCEDDEHSMWCLELRTGQFFKSAWNFPKELHSCDIVNT